MISRVFMRPRPLGWLFEPSDSPSSATSTTRSFNAASKPWPFPGSYRVDVSGGGGGGGGGDLIYEWSGGGGGAGIATTAWRPINSFPGTVVGMGGVAGTSTTSGGTAGGAGGGSSVTAPTGGLSAAGGSAGQPGIALSGAYVPPGSSAWPYPPAGWGKGGNGANVIATVPPASGTEGRVRFTLIG